MKIRLLIALLIFSIPTLSFSQEEHDIKNMINTITKNAIRDSTDKTVYHLMDELFQGILQSDNLKVSQETIAKIDKIVKSDQAKNKHLLILFLLYQNFTEQSVRTGQSNRQIQLEILHTLYDEYSNLYNQIPVIIYIYLAESYKANKQHEEVVKTLNVSRKLYPDAIPLKIYQYLETKDETLKADILKNHKEHWLVKQFITKN